MFTNKGGILLAIITIALAGWAGCAGTAPPVTDGGNANDNSDTGDGGNANTNSNTNSNDNGADPVPQATLFVVNNDGPSVTYYANAESLDGEIAPGGEVEAGAATSLFQPRSIVVTSTGRLLVSRQNGGIVGYDNALAISETTPADLVVDGNNTLLESPIAFAYDEFADRLFVGNVNGEDGILVFDNVSDVAFDGEVIPSRTFGPPDRTPFGTLNMTVDAMFIDDNGDLYVSDSQGDFSPNRDRILVFTNPGAASGSVTPARTINSDVWGQHQDIFVDDTDVLYVVDATATVCMFAGASTLDGLAAPSSTLTVNIALTDLQGVVVTSNGTGLLADRGNSAIYSIDDIATRSGLQVPDRTLDGFETQLRGPRQLWLVEDNDPN